MAEFGFTLK